MAVVTHGHFRQMRELAEQFGFDLDLTNKTHLRFVHRRTGGIVFASGTPSDRRAWKNIRANLRRAAHSHTREGR